MTLLTGGQSTLAQESESEKNYASLPMAFVIASFLVVIGSYVCDFHTVVYCVRTY